MFPGPLGFSIAGKALEKGLWSLDVFDLRDFALDKHRTVDDSPYGGGAGMVMKPDVVSGAIEAAKAKLPGARVIYPSPRGIPLTQELAETLKNEKLILLCGRFEGVDQRVIDHHDMLEVSLGDFILSGGEIAALALLDSIVRLLPGVMGNPETLDQESFSGKSAVRGEAGEPTANLAQNMQDFAGLLEYPHYTRPSIWNGRAVPEALLSGNHKRIHEWRLEQAKNITLARRPDLIKAKKTKD
jgi:tRNA (guanine37-N1)-methyltransferase